MCSSKILSIENQDGTVMSLEPKEQVEKEPELMQPTPVELKPDIVNYEQNPSEMEAKLEPGPNVEPEAIPAPEGIVQIDIPDPEGIIQNCDLVTW